MLVDQDIRSLIQRSVQTKYNHYKIMKLLKTSSFEGLITPPIIIVLQSVFFSFPVLISFKNFVYDNLGWTLL